jgi:hypothetical protein
MKMDWRSRRYLPVSDDSAVKEPSAYGSPNDERAEDTGKVGEERRERSGLHGLPSALSSLP